MSSSDSGLLSFDELKPLIKAAKDEGFLSSDDSIVNFYNFRVLNDRLTAVKNAFPDFWEHSIAVKSNPLTKVLSRATSQGFGLEAASYEETLQAERCDAPFIVWDSPVKTLREISAVWKSTRQVFINANGLDEFHRLQSILAHDKPKNISIGLRINPEHATSAQQSMQVGGPRSKFGEPISNRADLINALTSATVPFGLHVHSSSQNLQTKETVAAIKKVYNLASEIGWEKLAYFDLGGGFPVDYGFSPVETIDAYADQLQAVMPKLFDGSIKVITEFGRYYHANAGWTISQVAEVKRFEGHQTIIQHAGADLFLRECYEPGKWPHRLFLLSEHQQSTELNTDIGGPLCFGGDYIAKSVRLPEAHENDRLVIMDTGANSYALWSMHCSRPFPKVIGYDGRNLFVLKDRQSSEEAIALWG